MGGRDGRFPPGVLRGPGRRDPRRHATEEPPSFEDARDDALIGGTAEYLFKRWAPDAPPRWIGDRSRYLDRPWFPNASDDPVVREYLTFASPAAFKSCNVMADDEPLRRAAMPR